MAGAALERGQRRDRGPAGRGLRAARRAIAAGLATGLLLPTHACVDGGSIGHQRDSASDAPLHGSGVAGDGGTDGVSGRIGDSTSGRISSGDATRRAARRADVLDELRRDPPERDLVALAARLGRLGSLSVDEARTVRATPPVRREGDVEGFWVHDIHNERYLEIEARLERMTDEAYFWVQSGLDFDEAGMTQGAEEFSERLLTELRAAFGTEWSPGVDGDPRVHVLHHEPTPGIAGFFSSADAYTRAVDPRSNEREMFYINQSLYTPGSFEYFSLLAHELQHMIHWNHDRGEATWINEGLSEVAPHIVGYGTQDGRTLFAEPDVQLTAWQPVASANSAHYAAAYLFVAYLRGRFGDELLQDIVAAPGNGENGIEQALAAAGRPATFDEVFLDWVVANLVGSPIRDGEMRWGYPDGAAQGRATAERLDVAGARGFVNQHGTDYFDVTHLVDAGSLKLEFRGSPQVGLLDPLPSSAGDEGPPGAQGGGAYPAPSGPALEAARGARSVPSSPYPAPETEPGGEVRWSGRGDGMHSRMWRRLDLRGKQSVGVSLAFDLWFQLETNWDYGFLLASTDGGATWRTLPGTRTSSANANGNNLGDGWTGTSQGWFEERVDLTPLAGNEAILSFEVVTDDAVNRPGMAIVRPRLVDADAGVGVGVGSDSSRAGAAWIDSEWVLDGWRRVGPAVPQVWGLQAVIDTGGQEEPGVRRFAVDADGLAVLQLDSIPPDATVTLCISGLTPAVTNPAAYTLSAVDPNG